MSAYITWHTQQDDRVCPICKMLEGYKFGPYTEMPQSLVHPAYGVVWDFVSGSAAHEHGGGNSTCRCYITTEIDYTALIELLQQLIAKLSAAAGEVDDTKSGGSRSTTFEDLGIDPAKYGFG